MRYLGGGIGTIVSKALLLRARRGKHPVLTGNGVWRSLVAHLVWDQRVGGSNPLAPTSQAAFADFAGRLGPTPGQPGFSPENTNLC